MARSCPSKPHGHTELTLQTLSKQGSLGQVGEHTDTLARSDFKLSGNIRIIQQIEK